MKPWLSNISPHIYPRMNQFRNVEVSSGAVVEFVETLFWQSVNFVFAPRTVLRQLWICASLQLSVNVILYIRSSFLRIYGKIFRDSFRGKLERLTKELRRAPTYASWLDAAERYDRLVGCDKWRLEAKSALYDAAAVVKRTNELESFLQRVEDHEVAASRVKLSASGKLSSSDNIEQGGGRRRSNSGAKMNDPIAAELFALMFELRGGLGRTDYGLLHQGLFTQARLGTKVAIERYLSATCGSLRRLASMPVAPPDAYGHHSAHGGLGHGGWGRNYTPPPDTIPLEVKLSFFNEMRHAYGRTALMLSGGGTLSLYHVGVIKALFLAGLLPRVISGANGGAIVASTFATKTNEELVKLGYFEGFAHSLDFYKINHRMDGVYMCTDTLRAAIQANVGDWTFQEAFDRTGRILNVIVAPHNSTEPPILLNYLTAPHVLIWSAALASSCLPGVFEPVPLLLREPDGQVVAQTKGTGSAPQLFQDGSMDSELPMAQLSELFNVNHFIVSQANPQAGLLSSLSSSLSPALSHPLVGLAAGAVTFLKVQMRAWLNNLVTLVTEAFSIPKSTITRGVLQVLLQEYEGRSNMDVTLFPWKGQISQFAAFSTALENPTPEEFRVIISASERTTWGALPQVRAHVAVEVCLEQCVQHLRKALIARDNGEDTSSDDGTSSTTSGPYVPATPSSNAPSSPRGRLGSVEGKPAKKGLSRVPSFFTSKSQENLLALSESKSSKSAMSSNVDSQEETRKLPPPAPGVYDTPPPERNSADSLKCNTPLFSGHAIVDSPLKGWSWYANAPAGETGGESN